MEREIGSLESECFVEENRHLQRMRRPEKADMSPVNLQRHDYILRVFLHCPLNHIKTIEYCMLRSCVGCRCLRGLLLASFSP
ncbi:MAG: hypothetical protein AOA65_1306 [Candidatus Bathyarchaeota archaeon BA1]|nr:MAG: hypothetical protein AOA65_1306 [Candidatus Bathyarchaeota archaeon BA1]